MLRRYCKNKRGQSIVEFALVLPILLLIVFGIVHFGFLFYSYLTVNEAAREGARSAVVGETDAVVRARVQTASTLAIPNPAVNIVITPADTARIVGQPVTVTVTMPTPVPVNLPFVSTFVPAGGLTGTVTMRVENTP